MTGRLSAVDQQRLLVAWNRTVRAYPEVCAHEMFVEQVRRSPHAAALICGDDRVSYSELDAWSNRIARRLFQLDVGPESLVGLYMARSARTVAGILGILKTGGAYVPLDAAASPACLDFTLQDCRPRVVLTEDRLRERLPAFDGDVLCSDRDAAHIAAAGAADIDDRGSLGGLAYVLYTSAPGEDPKGVAVEHRGVTALINWAHHVIDVRQRAGVLAATSFCSDRSVFELFLPLTTGGVVVLADDLLDLPSLPAAGEVTLINAAPAAMSELVTRGGVPPSTNSVILSGGPLEQDLLHRIYADTGVSSVYDVYGHTEDTVYSTWTLRRPHGPRTMGRPISNTQAYLLGPRREPVAIGEIGELYLAGDGLARGYLNRQALTAERFVANPLAASDSDRLFKTGDLVRHLTDGTLEFLGRIDNETRSEHEGHSSFVRLEKIALANSGYTRPGAAPRPETRQRVSRHLRRTSGRATAAPQSK